MYLKDFYRNIAYLFYAVSMADRNMAEDEKKTIVKAVKEQWSINENGFESGELIYETIRTLIKKKESSEDSFEEFRKYVLSNKGLFTKKINYSLLETSHKICNIMNGKNKSELILLTKIHKLLGQT